MTGSAPYEDEGYEHLVEDGLAMRGRIRLSPPLARVPPRPGASASGRVIVLDVPADLAAMVEELGAFG